MLPGQIFDIVMLVIVIGLLVIYIARNREKVVNQPVVKFGNFPILQMVMVRTSWGINAMKWLAKKAGPLVRLFGYISIGVGVIGLILNVYLLFEIIRQMFLAPTTAQVGLVLPFTNVPGLGYLSFTHWIVAIAFLAAIHEFAHGVVAKAHKIPVKSSGIAVLSLLRIPLIPAAFVEPDEAKFPKRQHRQQHSVLAAGPTINILVAIPLFFLFVFAQDHTQELAGFSFANVTEDYPAQFAGITAGTVYDQINGVNAFTANQLLTNLSTLTPGDTIQLGIQESGETFDILTTQSPDNDSRAYIGVVGLTTQVLTKPQYQEYEWLILWTIELLRWLFLFNLLIGLMNLMPLFITDGGQIVKLYAYKFIKNKALAERVYRTICSISFYIILAAFIVPLIAGLW